MDINASRGMQEGLTEAQLTDLEDFESSEHFSRREKLALTYAERITLSNQDVDDALFAELQAEFPTPAEIVASLSVAASASPPQT